MSEIEKLKRANRLEDVIEETGYPLEDQGGGYWHGRTTAGAGLVVHVGKQRFYWDRLEESGDVIEWLRARFDWDLKKALRFLRTRADTPENERARARVRAVAAALEADQPPEEDRPAGGADPHKTTKAEPLGAGDEGRPAEDWRARFGKYPGFREAMRLGWDYPGGLGRMLDSAGKSGLYLDFEAWLRVLFIPLVGDYGGDVCGYCFRALDASHEGPAAFLAIELGDTESLRPETEEHISFDYGARILPRDVNWELFCGECVRKYGRWLRAVRMLWPLVRRVVERYEQQARERIETLILEELRLQSDMGREPREREAFIAWIEYLRGAPPGQLDKWPAGVSEVLAELVKSGRVLEKELRENDEKAGEILAGHTYRLPAAD